MKNSLLTVLALGLLLPAVPANAQLPILWKQQEKTKIEEIWYPEGNQEAAEVWATYEIWHDAQGKPVLAVLDSKEGNSQRVNFRYNEKGDLVERIHRMADTTELIFTWKHKYDDQGRKTEETSFDQEGKLISQWIRVYDEQGRLSDEAMFVRKLPEYQSWQFRDEEDGLKMHDARYLAYGPRHFYFNWSERIFLEYLNPFSLSPSEDVFQRYKFFYDEQGRVSRTELYDQLRTLVEEDDFFYDNKSRVRSLKNGNRIDSVLLVWDFQYGDHGEVKLARVVNTADQAVEPVYKTELELQGERIAVRKSIKVNNLSEVYFYNEQGQLVKRERRDLFNALIEDWRYGPDGRITAGHKYIENEVLELLRRYSYEQ